MATFIALLRGINVGGHNRVPMADLRSECGKFGWADVQTYIQSGNVLFNAETTADRVEHELEGLVERRFGLSVPVLARTAEDWSAYIPGNPFPEASKAEPKLVMLALSKAASKEDAEAGLRERAVDGERIARVGDVLWIHFRQGAGKSKLSPGLVDRLVGSPVTMRNWRTVLKLEELAKSIA